MKKKLSQFNYLNFINLPFKLSIKSLLLIIVFAFFSQFVLADGAIGYKGIYINKNGTKTWYKAHNVVWGYTGCTDFSFNSAADFSGQDFGSITSSETFEIAGFAVAGWVDVVDNFVAGKLLYKIWKQSDSEPDTWSEISVGNYGNPTAGASQVVCSSSNDRIVGYNNGTTNINPVTPGIYNLKIQALGHVQFSGGGGGFFNVNNGSEVTATFTVTPAPIISSISSSLPISSSIQTYKGATITVTGTNLGLVSTVKLGGSGGTTITGASISSNQITFVVPDGTSGGTVYVSDGTNSYTSSSSLTNLGYISKDATDWNTTSTWLGDAVPAVSSTVTIANNITLNAAATNNPTNITINATSGITFGASGAITVAGTLTNGGSIVMSDGGTLTMGSGSTLANGTATFTGGVGTVAFAGSATVSGTIVFNNVTIAGGVNFGSSSTVNGTLTVNASGYAITNGPTYGANSTLDFATGGPYTIDGLSALWVAGSTLGKGVPKNVVVSTTTPLNIYAAKDVTGNLTINSGRSVVQGNNAFTVQGNMDNYGTYSFVSNGSVKLIVNGNYYNYNGATTSLSATAGGDLEIKGNLNDNGTFNSNNRAIFFTGGNTQEIQGTGVFDIAYVIIDKTGGSVNAVTNLTSDVLTITAGTLNVNAEKQLTVNTSLTNDGVLTLKNAATVITYGTVSGSGTTNIEQTLTAGRNWWYLSSPVSGATTTIFNTNSNKIGYFNEPTALYTNPITSAETLTVGKGYVVKLNSAAGGTYTFTGGSLNTGTITLSPTRTGTTAGQRGFNLVGNPYPSYLDWDAAYHDATNPPTNLRDAIWYRTFSSGMVFHTYGDGDGVPEITTGKIPPMQGYWIKVKNDGSNGSITFKNTHRSHAGQTANPLKAKAVSNKQRLRLVLSNGTNTDETLIVGKSYASDNIDAYDIEKMSNNNVEIPEIFSLVNNEELVINSISQLSAGKKIVLGLRPGIAGNFSISATQFENIPSDVRVYLSDNFTTPATETELSEGVNYNFTSESNATNNRFSILFRSAGSITDCENVNAGKIYTVCNNNRLTIISNQILKDNASVDIYNQAGQKVATQKIVENTTTINQNLTPGIYFITMYNGQEIIRQKLIFK